MVPSFLPQTSTPPSAAAPGAPASDAGRADGMPADAAFDCALDDACTAPAGGHGDTPLPAETPKGRRTLADWWLSLGLGSPATDTDAAGKSVPARETDAEHTGEDDEDERPHDAVVAVAADAAPRRNAPLPVPADTPAFAATASMTDARPVIDDAQPPEGGAAPSSAPAATAEFGSRATSGDLPGRQTEQRTGGATTGAADRRPAEAHGMPDAVAHAAAHAIPARGPAEPASANAAAREGRADDALSTNISSASQHPAPSTQGAADADAYTMSAPGNDTRGPVAHAPADAGAAAQAGAHARAATVVTTGTAPADPAAAAMATTADKAIAVAAPSGDRSAPPQAEVNGTTGVSAASTPRAAADEAAQDGRAAVPPVAGDGASGGSTAQQGGRESGQADHAVARDLAPAANAPAIQPPAFTLVAAPDGTLRLTQLAAVVPPPLVMTTGETAGNVERMVQAMRVMIREKVQEATVHLRPEHFGDVRIDIRVEGKSVTALVQTDAASVREWLMAQEPSLRSGLSDQGLTLERLLVDRDPRHQRKDQQAQDQTPRRQRRAPDQDAQQTFEISV